MLKNKKILVIGDVMVDEIISGETYRNNPESSAPILNTNQLYRDSRLGGAANVALGFKKLEAEVDLLSFYGKSTILLNSLLDEEIKCFYEEYPWLLQGETTTKTRIIVNDKQHLRLDNDFIVDLPLEWQEKLLPILKNEYDAVVISDYNKGFVTRYICENINSKNKVFVDPKGIDVDKYGKPFLIKPNEQEYKALGLEGKKLDETHVVVTMGSKGVLFNEEVFPAKTDGVLDVCGAGDTFMVFLVAGSITGASIEESIQLANKAAGISVKNVGVYNPTIGEL